MSEQNKAKFTINGETGERTWLPDAGIEVVEQHHFIITPKDCNVGVSVHELHCKGWVDVPPEVPRASRYDGIKVIWVKGDFSVGRRRTGR